MEAGIPLRQIVGDAHKAATGAGYEQDDVRAAALAKQWPVDIIRIPSADEAAQPVNPIVIPDLSIAEGGCEYVVAPPAVSPN